LPLILVLSGCFESLNPVSDKVKTEDCRKSSIANLLHPDDCYNPDNYTYDISKFSSKHNEDLRSASIEVCLESACVDVRYYEWGTQIAAERDPENFTDYNTTEYRTSYFGWGPKRLFSVTSSNSLNEAFEQAKAKCLLKAGEDQ